MRWDFLILPLAEMNMFDFPFLVLKGVLSLLEIFLLVSRGLKQK